MPHRTIDTGTTDLLAHIDDGVAVLTMNRPERRNALSPAMLDALARTLADCETNAEIGAVVLTGADGAFCAGGDVKGMAARPESSKENDGDIAQAIDARIHRQRLNQRATAGRLYDMPKPTIAALPGAAAGAGLSLALACDLRIAAEGAVMTTAFAKVGFSGDYGGTYFLSRLVGTAKARELYFLSDKIEMKEARELGLVNRVVPGNDLMPATLELAKRLASGPRVAYRYMKENLNRASTAAPLTDCLDLEATHHIHCALTQDHREAAKAFVEKRVPRFVGR